MSSKNSRIMVPVDFGEQSLIALEQSFNLARLTRSDLILINVIDEDFLKPFQDMVSAKHRYEEHLRDAVTTRLKELAVQTTGKTGIHVERITRTGKIYAEIVAAAEEFDVSLIIMGTQGPIGLKKRFLGSNASRVVREAACPVITIKGKHHRTGCRHILLPLDLTSETKEKVNKAIELATLFGSVIHIVTIIDTEDEFLVNKLIRQMDQVRNFIENADVTCTAEFIQSPDVPESVLEAARRINADLIMIMTQQETGFTEFFLGSAAQEIINNSEVPVLSIRPQVKKDNTVFVIS